MQKKRGLCYCGCRSGRSGGSATCSDGRTVCLTCRNQCVFLCRCASIQRGLRLWMLDVLLFFFNCMCKKSHSFTTWAEEERRKSLWRKSEMSLELNGPNTWSYPPYFPDNNRKFDFYSTCDYNHLITFILDCLNEENDLLCASFHRFRSGPYGHFHWHEQQLQEALQWVTVDFSGRFVSQNKLN